MLSSPFLVGAVSVMNAAMSNSDILLVSAAVMILFLPSFIAARLTTKSVMALIAQIGQGAAFAVLTPYAVDAGLSCVLIGMIVMGVISVVRRRHKLTNAHLIMSGLVIGVIAFILNTVGHGFTLDFATTIVLLCITVLGAVISAWLANRVTQWIDSTALVQ